MLAKGHRGTRRGLALILLFLTVACSTAQAQDSSLVVVGATDVLTIAQAVAPDFEPASGASLEARWSEDPLQELRTGRADVALIGRELTPTEAEGNRVDTIAYDAVCILMDRRTARGGLEQGQVGLLIQPISRFEGLKNLALSDLRTRYAEMLSGKPGEQSWLSLTYYKFKPATVAPDSLQVKEDPNNPGHAVGWWLWTPAPLGGELSPVGLIDTQAALLQSLNLQAPTDTARLGFISPHLRSEEEWISMRFVLDTGEDTRISSFPFNFYLMHASREVTVRALEHGFSVEALMIDGVDPLGDPQDIYTGRYPLARRIHVVVKTPVSEESEKLVQHLLSPDGQLAIQAAGFLSLP